MADPVKKCGVKGRSRIISPSSVKREDALNFAPWSGGDTGNTSRRVPKPTRQMAFTY